MMIKKFFRWLRILVGGAAATQAINMTTSAKKEEPLPVIDTKEVVQEAAWFRRANNLIAEFKSDPVPVYSSNFSAEGADEPIGYIYGDCEVRNEKGEVIKMEAEVLLKDDVSFLKDTVKPDLSKSKIADYNDGTL